jgi:hypothetical protein
MKKITNFGAVESTQVHQKRNYLFILELFARSGE